MRVLGLDESITSFGWCVLESNKIIDKGTFKTDPRTGLMLQRLMLQRDRVKDLIKRFNIKYIGIEAPLQNVRSSEILYALNQFLHEIFLNEKLNVVQFAPLKLKALAIPTMLPTKVLKSDMVDLMKKEIGSEKRIKHDIADAYFAAKFGNFWWEWLTEKTDFSKLPLHVQQSFKKEHTFTRGKKKGFVEKSGIYYRKNSQYWVYKEFKPLRVI